MKPETARGARRLVPRRRRARRRADASGGPATTAAGWPPGVLEQSYVEFGPAEREAEDAGEGDARIRSQPRNRADASDLDPSDGFDPAEFAEFLEADDSPIPADPAFKERLRQRLWGMVRDNAAGASRPAPTKIGDRPRRPFPDPKSKPPR